MYATYVKRAFDIILSIIGLLILGIIILPIGALIYFEDKGDIFYITSRLGKSGKAFKMYKFRSMKMNAPDIRMKDGSTYNSANDYRLTKIGKILRLTSLDEAPQIINVLLGDMSIIGPRPDLPEHYFLYKGNEYRKLEVKPGISGYSQAFFRNSISWKDRIQKDIYYIDNLSFLLDLKIFFKTINVVFRKDSVYIDQTIADKQQPTTVNAKTTSCNHNE